jgi:hypothetical protein
MAFRNSFSRFNPRWHKRYHHSSRKRRQSSEE